MMAAGEHLQKDWILYCLWIPVVFWYLPCYRLFPSCGYGWMACFSYTGDSRPALRLFIHPVLLPHFLFLYGGGNGIIDCKAITGRVMGNMGGSSKEMQGSVNGLEKRRKSFQRH